jgi:DNA-binding GntR family transcriptional regulator
MTEPSSRVEVAHEALRRAIIEQALKPGTKLPEDEIGNLFGMSRTLVREVLARLAGAGLVDARPKRTATVAEPTLAEAQDVFGLRRALEAEVVRLVIKRWEPAFGAALEGLVREEDAARARHDDRVSVRLAGEFHTMLARMSGNALLERYLGEVVTRCSLILAVFGRPHSSDCAVSEHSDIIAALRSGDAAKAMVVMDAHVEAVADRALLGGREPVAPTLASVLADYAGLIEAKGVTTPMPPKSMPPKSIPARKRGAK